MKLDPLPALAVQLASMANQIANLSVQKSQNEQVASASFSHIPAEIREEAHYMNNGIGNFRGNHTQILHITTRISEIMRTSCMPTRMVHCNHLLNLMNKLSKIPGNHLLRRDSIGMILK